MDKNSTNINLLKIVASFMVIIIHVSAVNFPKLGKVEWDVSNVYNSFSRVSVPIFFIISGYFLIGRSESVSSFYKRRFLKILPPLIFWSAVFYGYNTLYIGVDAYNALELLIRPASAHLWYLYAILGLYLFSPFISKIYVNSSAKERIAFLSIWIISTSIIPTINSSFGMFLNLGLFQLTSIYGYIGFFFLGAWIKDNPSPKSRRVSLAALCLYASMSVATMYLTSAYSISSGKPSGIFYNYTSPFVIIASIAMFYFFTSLQLSGKLITSIASTFSSFSLGVYCIHPLFIWPLAKHFRIGGDVQPTEYYILLTCVIVFITSCISSYIFSRLPVFKKVF